jgi:hypothetical protein
MFDAVKTTLTASMCFYLTNVSLGYLGSWRWAHYFVYVASSFLCSKILEFLLTTFCVKSIVTTTTAEAGSAGIGCCSGRLSLSSSN